MELPFFLLETKFVGCAVMTLVQMTDGGIPDHGLDGGYLG